jgi:hypothetical protein
MLQISVKSKNRPVRVVSDRTEVVLAAVEAVAVDSTAATTIVAVFDPSPANNNGKSSHHMIKTELYFR